MCPVQTVTHVSGRSLDVRLGDLSGLENQSGHLLRFSPHYIGASHIESGQWKTSLELQ